MAGDKKDPAPKTGRKPAPEPAADDGKADPGDALKVVDKKSGP